MVVGQSSGELRNLREVSNMNGRMVLGILFLVVMFLMISAFLFKLLGIFAIPFIIIVGVSGIAGWHHGGKDSNHKG